MSRQSVREAYAHYKASGSMPEIPSEDAPPPLGRMALARHLRRAALHEAGHAVAALACGWIVARVCVGDGTNDARGCVVTWPVPALKGSAAPWDPVAFGIIGWGGATADGSAPMIYGEDALGMEWLTEVYGVDGLSIRVMRDACAVILKKHHRAVRAIAVALYERRVLGQRAIRRIAVAASPALRRLVSAVPQGVQIDVHVDAWCKQNRAPHVLAAKDLVTGKAPR